MESSGENVLQVELYEPSRVCGLQGVKANMKPIVLKHENDPKKKTKINKIEQGEGGVNSRRGQGGPRPENIHSSSPISKKTIEKTRSVAIEGETKNQNTENCNHSQSWRQKLLKFRALNTDDRQVEVQCETQTKK